MFLSSCFCDWKCCKEAQVPISICQNAALSRAPILNCPDKKIFDIYIKSPITKAIVIGGLEPLLQKEEVISLINFFRARGVDDTFVIYTGYKEEECKDFLAQISGKNVVMKFGRFLPNDKGKHYDEILGVSLISSNQYGRKF